MKENAIIFGDSYSTFDGYIPKGYEVYYSDSEFSDTDVRRVEDTWWYQVAKEADLNIVENNSWSGSTICYLGYDNVDCSKTSSFIHRLREMKENGFFEKNEINKVFVFGGTNDSWSDDPLGEVKFENWKNEELYCVLPAVCYFLNLVKETVPQAEIYCLINTEIKDEITACMKEACERYGIIPVNFDNIDKVCGHPTIQGMKDIKNEVLKVMSK